MVSKRIKHFSSNNVGWCFTAMFYSFGRALCLWRFEPVNDVLMTWLHLQIRQTYERNVSWTLVGTTIRLDWTHNQLKVVRNTLIRLYKHLEGVSKQCMELVGESWLILPKRGTKHMILIIIFFLFANRTTADKRLHIHPPWRRMSLQADSVSQEHQ